MARNTARSREFHTQQVALPGAGKGTPTRQAGRRSERRPPHHRRAPRRRQGRKPRPRAVGASTPRAGAAPTLRFRRPPGPRPSPPPPAPPLASRSSTRTPGPRAPRQQNSGPRSPPLGEGGGRPGRSCGAEAAPRLRWAGSGPPSEQGRSRHPPAGVPPPWAAEADPSVLPLGLSLPLISLGAHLPTQLPAACATASARVLGPRTRQTPSQLRSAAQPNCGPRPRGVRTNRWAVPHCRWVSIGQGGRGGRCPGQTVARRNSPLLGLLLSLSGRKLSEALLFLVSTGAHLCSPLSPLQVLPIILPGERKAFSLF